MTTKAEAKDELAKIRQRETELETILNTLDSPPITERVKTIKDACEVNGEDYDAFLKSCEGLPEDEVGYREVKMFARALNEGWVPDYDSNEYKYWPVFNNKGRSGVGFSLVGYYYLSTYTYAGGRQVFKSRELAVYAGNQILESYKKFFTK